MESMEEKIERLADEEIKALEHEIYTLKGKLNKAMIEWQSLTWKRRKRKEDKMFSKNECTCKE